MIKGKNLDRMDRIILRVLSSYEGLTPLELWYELGEDDTVKQKPTEEEVANRLESLKARGFVGKGTGTEDDEKLDSLNFHAKGTRGRMTKQSKGASHGR